MTKLPEPEYMGCDAVSDIFGYTEAQMLQFRRDALEEAADAVHEIPRNGVWVTKVEAIAAILKLKDET